jgi:hypothetical protein
MRRVGAGFLRAAQVVGGIVLVLVYVAGIIGAIWQGSALQLLLWLVLGWLLAGIVAVVVVAPLVAIGWLLGGTHAQASTSTAAE